MKFINKSCIAVNLVQPGLNLSKPNLFLGASLDSIVTNVESFETCGVEIKCPSSKRDQSINDILKKQNFFLQKVNGKIQLKRS